MLDVVIGLVLRIGFLGFLGFSKVMTVNSRWNVSIRVFWTRSKSDKDGSGWLQAV